MQTTKNKAGRSFRVVILSQFALCEALKNAAREFVLQLKALFTLSEFFLEHNLATQDKQ